MMMELLALGRVEHAGRYLERFVVRLLLPHTRVDLSHVVRYDELGVDCLLELLGSLSTASSSVGCDAMRLLSSGSITRVCRRFLWRFAASHDVPLELPPSLHSSES